MTYKRISLSHNDIDDVFKIIKNTSIRILYLEKYIPILNVYFDDSKNILKLRTRSNGFSTFNISKEYLINTILLTNEISSIIAIK